MMLIKYNYIVFFFLSIQISEQITNYLKQIISSGSVWKKKRKNSGLGQSIFYEFKLSYQVWS